MGRNAAERIPFQGTFLRGVHSGASCAGGAAERPQPGNRCFHLGERSGRREGTLSDGWQGNAAGGMKLPGSGELPRVPVPGWVSGSNGSLC